MSGPLPFIKTFLSAWFGHLFMAQPSTMALYDRSYNRPYIGFHILNGTNSVGYNSTLAPIMHMLGGTNSVDWD